MGDQRVRDLFEAVDSQATDEFLKASLRRRERTQQRMKISPGRIRRPVIRHDDPPNVLHVFTSGHDLHRREPQTFLKHLGRSACKRTHRHAADLGDVGDVRRISDQLVAEEHRLHEQVLRHVTLTAVGIVVNDHVAGLEAVFTEFFDTEWDRV